MACSASSSSGISTNAKPRDRPVSRSVTILTLSTAPWTSKRARTSSSLALKARFPTKIFFTSSPLDLESELAGAGSRRQLSLGSCGLVWRAIKYPSSVAGSRARQDGPREGFRRLFSTAARTDPRASRRRIDAIRKAVASVPPARGTAIHKTFPDSDVFRRAPGSSHISRSHRCGRASSCARHKAPKCSGS